MNRLYFRSVYYIYVKKSSQDICQNQTINVSTKYNRSFFLTVLTKQLVLAMTLMKIIKNSGKSIDFSRFWLSLKSTSTETINVSTKHNRSFAIIALTK